MLDSQTRTANSGTARQAYRVLSIFALVTVSAVVLSVVSVSSRSITTNPSAERESRLRTNHRVSMRPSTGASRYTSVRTPGVAAPLLASITVDRTDDSPTASACTAAANDCSLRGSVAFANLNPGTTIVVPAGTYQLTISGSGEGFSGNDSIGDLDITATNTNITGAGAATTIIQQTQLNDRVIEVNPFLDSGFATSISDVSISDGHETTGIGGGGIVAGSINNALTITNCVFSGNSATDAGTFGGGGISFTGGSLNLSGTTFSGNSTSGSGGGVGYSAGDVLGRTPSTGTLTVTNSTFTNNATASISAGGGAADLFDFNLSSGSYNITSSSFQGNTATNGSGGAIIVESGGPLTVSTSSFAANQAAISGGAIFAGGSAASVTYSRLVGNTVTSPVNGLALFRGAGTFTANDNWWGSNSGPTANDFRSSTGSISPATYLQLRISASPDTICPGASSTLTADIKQRSVGAPLTTELNGLPAFPVPAGTIFSNAVLGTLSGASVQFVNGVATATYTAGGTAGMGSADATADNQTVTASILIQAAAPVITLSTSNINMWPPNHTYHTFNVTDFVASATSSCDPNVDVNDVVIVRVSSDEPEDSLIGADGTTLNDIVIAADCKSVQLRIERDANLNGRVYTITFRVTDSFGNTTTATATVSIPIDQSGAPAVDNGPGAGYTVISACP
jgi:hypothetical protein